LKYLAFTESNCKVNSKVVKPQNLIKVFIIVIASSLLNNVVSQKNSDRIAAVVTLDSFTVIASKQGFNVSDFIDLVINDASFYKAFQNLRITNCEFSNSVLARHNLRKEYDSHESRCQQEVDYEKCRKMNTLSINESAGFKKRKQKHQYYTAELYENVFFTKGEVCSGNQIKPHTDNRIEAIKRFMFSPGQKIDLPIIGRKTGIFEQKNLEDYEFSISQSQFQNSSIYIFAVKLKEKVRSNKYLINSMETYFSRTDFSVVYRRYHLKFNNGIVNCDIKLSVTLQHSDGSLLPKMIQYEGFWNIPFKRKEDGEFTFKLIKSQDR
jgi:hypothetical protein